MLKGKTWLVTGGTGSLGQNLVRHIFEKHDPVKVVVYARDAGRHVAMRREFDDSRLRHIIGDVRDEQRLSSAMRGVDYVVHAAAQKHIDIGEYNPTETHSINVGGTEMVARCAVACGVSRAVLISTDKAVEPLNIYGVSKAAAERIWLGKCVDGKNIFTVARYGNVINSDGAIIPKWREQVRAGNHVFQVTDEHSTRFAMTFAQAIYLIEQALIGPPQGIYCAKASTFSLLDLCAVMGGCLERTGLRAAEKKHEVLVSRHEANRAVDTGTCYLIRPELPADTDIDYAIGTPLFPDFEIASKGRESRLSMDELCEMIAKV
jgi:UDP-N-acetylglucosamine 4,6-dehydratase/5-epimerase